jgi:hypothetical protein
MLWLIGLPGVVSAGARGGTVDQAVPFVQWCSYSVSPVRPRTTEPGKRESSVAEACLKCHKNGVSGHYWKAFSAAATVTAQFLSPRGGRSGHARARRLQGCCPPQEVIDHRLGRFPQLGQPGIDIAAPVVSPQGGDRDMNR